jgi:hypothetical protein
MTIAETVVGLYKTELIRRRVPWRTVEQVELPRSGSTGGTGDHCIAPRIIFHRPSSKRATMLKSLMPESRESNHPSLS